MLKDMFHGLCMAMAVSVPGVSGGSIRIFHRKVKKDKIDIFHDVSNFRL